MFIRVAAGAAPELVEPEDCKKFHVEAAGMAEGSLPEVLAGLGDWADGGAEGHVWIVADAVRAAAAPQVSAEWAADFDGMVGYAASKGWLNEAGTAIRAHVVYAG